MAKIREYIYTVIVELYAVTIKIEHVSVILRHNFFTQ